MDNAALMEFSVCAGDFIKEWKRCNMVANYLASYSAWQFPEARETSENLISSLANEVLEALAAAAPPESRLDIRLVPESGTLVMELRHDILPVCIIPWLEFFDSLEKTLDDRFYLLLLSGNYDPQPAFNQLGLAMLVHDFGAWIKTRQDPGSRSFVTQVSVTVRGEAS